MKDRIILFNPPLFFSSGLPQALDVTVPPLGLLYLSAFINKYYSDFQATVTDIAVERFGFNDIGLLLKREKPFVVGVTSMTPQLQGAVELATFVRKNFPKIKIFLGGPHISADSDFLNRFTRLFDYGITGEAEKTFANSLVMVLKRRKIPKVQMGEPILDLDTIPFPDKKLIKRERYSDYESMMFGRGCPFNCYYCSRPSISRRVRYRSADNLIKEIKEVYPYCQGKIDFQDDTFTLNRERILEFCSLVVGKKLKLNWRCNTRIDLVDGELLTKMRDAGCELIHFGIEAGNEKIRKEVVCKGQFTNEQVLQVIRWCHQVRIKFAGYFMIGHPSEGRRELQQTKKMILESGIDLMGLSIPTPFPGSRLYEIAKERGIVNEEIIDKFARKKLGEGYAGNYPVLISEKLKAEDVYGLMKEINRHFYISWRFFWHRLKEDFTSFSKLKQDFFDLLSLILRGVSTRKPYIKKRK